MSAAARLVLVAAAVRWCHGATEGAGELHPAQITVLIQNTRKIPELVKLDAAKGHMFNAIHLSVYWNRVKMLAGTPRSLERRALYRHAEALRPACDRTRAAVLGPPGLHARGVAMIAHSFARAGLHRGEPWELVWSALPKAARDKMSDFNSQELANIAWAFATAGRDAPELFEALAMEASTRIGSFLPQELSNTAWAFATAGQRATALFDTLASECVRRVAEFNSQELANTVWAFASAQHKSPELFSAIARESRDRLGEFTSQELAITARSFATLATANKRESKELFAGLAVEVYPPLTPLRPPSDPPLTLL